MNRYYLRVKALAPLHIGAGEDYIPTNYVIVDGLLYEFDEQKFYQQLSENDKKAFVAKSSAGIVAIKGFYQDHKELAKSLAIGSVKVSKSVATRYVVKVNKNGTVNTNQLEISKTIKEKNTKEAYLPGSTIKGMLETALEIYPKANDNATNEVRQKLKLSDAFSVDSTVEIGFMRRADKEKNRIINKNGGVSHIAEVIQNGSTFALTLDTELSFEQIKAAVESYQEKKENKISSKSSAFIARIGMGSGKAYMLHKDKIAMNNKQPPAPVSTHWLFDNDSGKFASFGWIECEVIDETLYNEFLSKYKMRLEDVKRIYNAYEKEQVTLRVQREKERLKRSQRLREEADKKIKEETKKAETLAAMSPVERLVSSYDDVAVLINDMRRDEIEDFDTIKLELAEAVKKKLQKDSKQWEKAKKKALDRKQYIESILDN